MLIVVACLKILQLQEIERSLSMSYVSRLAKHILLELISCNKLATAMFFYVTSVSVRFTLSKMI